MASPYRVAVIVGSLRKQAYSLRTAQALAKLAPDSLKLDIVTLHGLSMYNQDLETDAPPADWTAFRHKIKAADAVVFVTPEYNRSIPGVLKNAVDVGSRPYGKSVFDKKPAGVVSNSPGAIGGFGANHHLRQCLVFLNMPTLQQPEAYVGGIADAFDEHGELVKESLREFLKKYIDAFAAFVAQQAK
jgi:chromate reductase